MHSLNHISCWGRCHVYGVWVFERAYFLVGSLWQWRINTAWSPVQGFASDSSNPSCLLASPDGNRMWVPFLTFGQNGDLVNRQNTPVPDIGHLILVGFSACLKVDLCMSLFGRFLLECIDFMIFAVVSCTVSFAKMHFYVIYALKHVWRYV